MEGTPFNGPPALRAHRDSLKSLTLFFKTCVTCFFCQDWCPIDLPHLTNLTLITPKMSFSPSLANYVRQFANSLVSLTIPYNLEFEYLEAKEFCKTLIEFRSLRHLNLSVRGFSPSTLAQFAGVLPRLRSLILNYKFICPYQDNRDYVPTLLPRLVSFQALFISLTFTHLRIVPVWNDEVQTTILHMGIRVVSVPSQYLYRPMHRRSSISHGEDKKTAGGLLTGRPAVLSFWTGGVPATWTARLQQE